MNFPVILAVVSLLAMWLAGRIGSYIREKRMAKRGEPSSDFNLAVTATLTLLGLIIGFSFSMAMSRYDQRKNYEEAEANAIGTEYVRVDVLPAADALKIKSLLAAYTDLRIAFYRSGNWNELQRINADTAQMQDQLWSDRRSPCIRTAHCSLCPHLGGNERRSQFPGIYPGCLVVSHSHRSLDFDDRHRSLCQFVDGFRSAGPTDKYPAPCPSASRRHLVPAGCGY